MKTVATISRMKKEQKIKEIFEKLFAEIKEPITTQSFIEKSYNEFKDYYSKNMISTAFSSMTRRRMIQRVFWKEGKSPGFLYAPIDIDIPHEKRQWETYLERNRRKEAFLEDAQNIKKDDYDFFLRMVSSPKLPKEERRRMMPISSSLKRKDADYKRFIHIIKPYLPMIEERSRFVIIERLGIDDGELKPIKEIGQKIGVGYAQTNEIFTHSLYRIENLMTEKINGQ